MVQTLSLYRRVSGFIKHNPLTSISKSNYLLQQQLTTYGKLMQELFQLFKKNFEPIGSYGLPMS